MIRHRRSSSVFAILAGYTPEPLAQQTASSDVSGGEAQRFVQGLDIPGQWWTLFHSSALNTLIEEALNNNPTLPAAEAALRQAWENVYAQQGAFFPTLDPVNCSLHAPARGIISILYALAVRPIGCFRWQK